MTMTDFHGKFFAFELPKRCAADNAEKLAVDAQVDLNPHQAEAVLFAFRSPLAKGPMLADEIGLGKTMPPKRPRTSLFDGMEGGDA